MDVDIISEEENPMLHRTDVTFELVHEEATPSRLQVRDSLAAKLNKDAAEVVIRKLDTKFGMRKTVGHAKVYDTAAHATDVEQEHMLERNKIETDDEADSEADAEAEAEAEAEEA
ncbi:30S ribosomal protein S24e [Halobacteria archaeon AArc-m2/3/4]|uniref:Small ribosomal subunit protein eS24 n=1 Tax=Natronoglomus mannanivorans TaxID=2979990 RepID=A0ABT2QI56_9EURY|nr:30S ribosomal protein S24e [Halobacteria archaeon AArc-m2/3/4]